MLKQHALWEWKVNLMLVSRNSENSWLSGIVAFSARATDSLWICISALFHGHTKMFGLGYLYEPEGSSNSARVCMGSPGQSDFYQAGCRNSSAREKSLRHVTSFKAHSRLITMALDHFLTFCWPIERSAGPTLSHAHSSSILLLLLSNPWLPLQQPQSHRMNGAAWGMWTQREECHFAECYPPNQWMCAHTHTHTGAPHKSRHV